MPGYCRYCKNLTGSPIEEVCIECNPYECGEGVIRSDSWDGKMRTLYKRVCNQCEDDYYVPIAELKKTKYCNKKCRALGSRKRIKVKCHTCKKDIEKTASKLKNSRSGLSFCNRKCKELAQSIDGGVKEIQPHHYDDGHSVYRRRAFKKYGKFCAKCGYHEYEQMLDVDHIDSDRTNNKIENLQVLCVWCHALKTRKIPYHKGH